MDDDSERDADRALKQGAEEFMRGLAENVRTGWQPGSEEDSRYWVGLVSGAVGALRATGQLSGKRARQLELEALQPLFADGSITPIEKSVEESRSLDAADPDDEEHEDD